MRRHDFKKLKVWQLSKDLTVEIYKLTYNFPQVEKFGLTSQLRKSAISVPSNISEGCGRGTDLQLSHFLDIAQGSAYELETQLIIAHEVGILSEANLMKLSSDLSEIQRMISGFQKKIKHPNKTIDTQESVRTSEETN